MKKLLKKIWDSISRLFYKVEDKTRELVPIAIKIVEGIKKVMDTNTDEIVQHILTTAISGEIDDILIKKVRKFIETNLPKILLQLRLIDSIANIEDPNEQLKAILAEFKLSSDKQKNIAYHEIASLSLEALSDGKITRSESIVLSEYYYTNILNK